MSEGGASRATPFSCVPGIEWPGLAAAAGASMLALQWQLGRSQWWPRERLLRAQLRQLGALLRHAAGNVPYYRDLEVCRELLRPEAELTPQALARLPILRKRDLGEHPERLRAARYPAEHGARIESATTGSTGEPVRVAYTAAAQYMTHALVLRNHLWHQLDLAGKLAVMTPHVEDGSWLQWDATATAAFRTGPGVALNSRADVDRQLDWLLEERPAYVQTQVSNLQALVLRSRESGRIPASVRAVLTQSERLPPDLRELTRDTWQAALIDAYSCGEFGAIALQCPKHDHYHVQAESVYLELLREDGTPCSEGEIGRVVLSTLHNFATPLVRYDLGDYAELGGACDCGRGLPVLRRIAGRVRNMARDPTGRRFWPSFRAELWLEVAPFRQIRLVQQSIARIEVQYVLARELDAAEQAKMSALLQRSLAYPFEIVFSRIEPVTRTPGEKFEDFVSLIDQDSR